MIDPFCVHAFKTDTTFCRMNTAMLSWISVLTLGSPPPFLPELGQRWSESFGKTSYKTEPLALYYLLGHMAVSYRGWFDENWFFILIC